VRSFVTVSNFVSEVLRDEVSTSTDQSYGVIDLSKVIIKLLRYPIIELI